MTRARAAGVVVAVALLVVLAQPAGAAHTVTASIHTTESDFNSAEQLSNVQVSGTGAAADVVLNDTEHGTTATRDADNDAGTVSGKWGIVIVPQNNLKGVTFTLSSNTGSVSTAYIHDTSGTQLASTSISGTTETINHDLTAGTTYYLTTDNGGSNYDLGWGNGNQNFPYGSGDINITAGVSNPGGSTSTSNSEAYNILSVQAITVVSNGTYIGPNHSVSNPASAFTNLTLSSANATVTWEHWDGASWTQEAQSFYTTGGNKSQTLPDKDGDWRVNVTFSDAGDPSTAELHDEGINVTTTSPSVDNGSASPSNGVELTDNSVTLSIDSQDADFATIQGDGITGTFYVDGSPVGTDSRSSNGTLSVTTRVSGSGDHTWHVDVTDDYGHTQTSQTFDFTAPAELKVYNESNATQLVNGVTTELRFYFQNGSTLIVDRNTSDGTINMSGLPADRPFIVVADAPGFHSRRIYVESLYETQRIYLLPESEPHRNVVFDLEDFSGRFPEEDTVMLVQRALENETGNVTWQTVHGDFFGATGEFPATLRYNVRHRLILINTETGYELDKRNYTPFANATEVVRVTASGEIVVQNVEPDVTISPATRSLPARNATIKTEVTERDGNVSSWGLEIIYDNGSNTTLVSKTYSSAQTVSHEVNLTNRTGGEVHVVVNWTLASGATGTDAATFRVREYFDNSFSLLAVLGSVTGRLPAGNVDMFTTMVAVLSTVFIMGVVASQLRTSPEVVGFVGVLGLAAWGVIGWIGYGTVFVAAMAFFVMAALGRGI